VGVGRVDRVHEADERALEDAAERRLARRAAAAADAADAAETLGPSRRCCAARPAERAGPLCSRRRRLGLGDGGLGRVGAVEDLLEERVARRREEGDVLVRDGVAVLLEEALGLVRDVERVVGDREGVVAEAWLLEHLGVLGLDADGRVQLLEEVGVRARREARLLVEEREDAELALDEVDRRLVVGVVDEGPVDLLADVLLLLELEDVRVELRATRRVSRVSFDAQSRAQRRGG